MKYSTTLLTLNKSNFNSNVYSTEVIEKMIEKSKSLMEKRLLVTSHMTKRCEINLGDAVDLVTDMKIVNDELIGEIEFFPVLLDRHFPMHMPSFESQINNTLFVRPSGLGAVNKDGAVSGYTLNYFALTTDPA